MGRYFASGLLAGVTAAVIWTSICLITGIEAKTIGLWALIFLVVGTVLTMVIANVIGTRKAESSRA
ncbi:hypothetical protein [Microbacterium gorillae]|uniref:hypothetical protein n=1 Tax=Microbacterium gorillae TaxID=1231063 RepID=UPI00058E359F|nr:hypothetical protein [Microbacterium gorillae]